MMRQIFDRKYKALEGVEEFVRGVWRHYPLAICSGALREEIEAMLEGVSLRDCFSVIVAAEDVTVGNHKVTYVQAEGTYKSGMPGGPQTPMPDYALAGAIIEASEGSVFVRMTGPKTLAKASLADFKKMVEGALK